MYVLWLHFLCVNLLPLTLLFWLNTNIYRTLTDRLVTLRRTGNESLRRRELRFGRVSLAIVLLFMVCHFPKLVPTLCEVAYADPKVEAQKHFNTTKTWFFSDRLEVYLLSEDVFLF